MRPRRRTPLAGGAIGHILPLLIVALPGGHHGGIMPGVQVSWRHQWASVCLTCQRVEKTTIARAAKVTCSHGHKCVTLPLERCDRCRKVLVYEPDSEISGKIVCRRNQHRPRPMFTGTPISPNSEEYTFTPERSR